MFSTSLLLLLLLAAVSCEYLLDYDVYELHPLKLQEITHELCSTGVHSVELTQPGSMVINPGQSVSLICKVSGYSVTDSSYCTHWIRQPAGKALEWVGRTCGGGYTDYSDKLKSRFEVSRDTSSSTVTLRGQNLQTGDTAVYYCAREPQ